MPGKKVQIMSEKTDNLHKEVSEAEEIDNLADNLRRNGLSGSVAESVELAKKIISRQHMMYGYISAKKPEVQNETKADERVDERFKKPDYNVAEEEGTTLKDLIKETEGDKEPDFSFMPQKAEPVKPDEKAIARPENPSSPEKTPDEAPLSSPENSSLEKKPDEKKEEKITSELQESKAQ
jgi:deoxyribodipyrimidine photolyase